MEVDMEKIRRIAKETHLDVYGLGLDREKWESALKRYTDAVVQECIDNLSNMHCWQTVNHQNYPKAWHNAIDDAIENIRENWNE
jgi:hypothetical protein